MKIQLKPMFKASVLALLAFVAVEQTSQAQISITMSVNGYFGSNLSSTGANLADGTIVKLGMFYNNSAFTPTADVSASWAALSGSMQSRLSTFDDNFYSFASATTSTANGNGAEFQVLYSPDPDVQPDAAFQKFFTLSPAGSKQWIGLSSVCTRLTLASRQEHFLTMTTVLMSLPRMQQHL